MRTTREWNKYDLSVARTVQIADAHEFLYGQHSTVTQTHAGARGEAVGVQNVMRPPTRTRDVLFLGLGGKDSCYGPQIKLVVAHPPFTDDQIPKPTPTPNK